MMTESQFLDYVQSLNLKSPAPPNNEQMTPKAGPWYVVDNIYLGCLDNARNVGLMCTVGINAMLNCAAPHEYQPMYTKAMELYHHFQARDAPDYAMDQHFEAALQFLSYCRSHKTAETEKDFKARDAPDYAMDQHFEAALQFLSYCRSHKTAETEKDFKVLVYCKQGINRSVTICVVYLVVYHAFTLTAAVQYMMQVKTNILSNNGFLRGLYRFCERYGYSIQ